MKYKERKSFDGLRDELESMIDTYSIAVVLEALSEVCYLKADHLQSNWQDKETAEIWEKIGKSVDKCI